MDAQAVGVALALEPAHEGLAQGARRVAPAGGDCMGTHLGDNRWAWLTSYWAEAGGGAEEAADVVDLE